MHPLERLILSALLVAPTTRRLTVRESLARLAVSYYVLGNHHAQYANRESLLEHSRDLTLRMYQEGLS